MAQLRPHLSEATFCEQALRQIETQGYHLAAVEEKGSIVAVAGYRFVENLALGSYLYVDDLITDDTHRGQGFGGQLFDWIAREAERAGCRSLHLDSGVQRFAAHRFYLGKGMEMTSRHFGLALRSEPVQEAPAMQAVMAS
jgi:GNAT superfamily N-acetyltransferase